MKNAKESVKIYSDEFLFKILPMKKYTFFESGAICYRLLPVNKKAPYFGALSGLFGSPTRNRT